MIALLQDKEDQINKKEQEIKNYRNKNHHLQNFRAVYDYRVNTLLDEKQPLTDHYTTLDHNVKIMYRELIDESEADKKIKNSLAETREAIDKLHELFRSKKDHLFRSKSAIAALQHDILQALKHPEVHQFRQLLLDVHHQHFQVPHPLPASIGSELVGDKDNDELLLEMEHNTQQAIKDELMRQRDFLSKKISAVSKLNRQNEDDRDELILRVQNENTSLIRECNTLREEKKGLKEHFSNMQKAYDILSKEIKILLNHLGGDTHANVSIDMEDLINPNHSARIELMPSQKFIKKPLQPTGFQRYQQDKQEKELKYNNIVVWSL